MEYAEAIRILKEEKKLYESDYCTPGDGTPDGTLLAAIDEGIAGLEMRIPKKVLNRNRCTYGFFGICPNCKNIIENNRSFKLCAECGQAIDWNEEEEE